jgi:hypothetical protein
MQRVFDLVAKVGNKNRRVASLIILDIYYCGTLRLLSKEN